MRRSALWGAVTGVVVACSRFGSEEAPDSTLDAGGDGSTLDGAVGPDSGVDQPCTGFPRVTFDGVETNGPKLSRAEEQGGTLSVSAGASRLVLEGAGNPPEELGDGVRAFGSWSWPYVGRNADVTFDFAAVYGGSRVYAEAGCRLKLASEGGSRSASVVVVFDRTGSASLSLGGRHYPEAGDTSFRGDPVLADAIFSSSLSAVRHAQLHLRPGPSAGQLIATGRVDSGPEARATIEMPLPSATLQVSCGLLYADNSDAGELTVRVSNVSVRACE